MAKVLDSFILKKSFVEVLDTLSKKEKEVISRRIWLDWNKETLQWIWSSFKPWITRERVRQIEETWINKIWRIIDATPLYSIQQEWIKLLNMSWWILSSERLINWIIKALDLPSNINSSIIEVVLQSDFNMRKSKPRLWVLNYFHLPYITREDIDVIHKEASRALNRRKDVMEKQDLYTMILNKFPWNLKDKWIVFIDSVLDLFEDIVKWEDIFIWLTKWKILNPKTLKDKAIYVLKKEWIPMHFVDISNHITKYLWDSVKINTIHNELIRNTEFVLIWRWIYALKEWWFIPWAVIDVIETILKKNNWPMTTEQIIEWVLKTRKVKKTTIYMNLQNKNIIERVWRNYYQLKQK